MAAPFDYAKKSADFDLLYNTVLKVYDARASTGEFKGGYGASICVNEASRIIAMCKEKVGM